MMRSPSPPRISQQANRSNVESPHSQPPVKKLLESVEARGHFSFSSGCRLRAVPAFAPPGPRPHGKSRNGEANHPVFFSLNLEEH